MVFMSIDLSAEFLSPECKRSAEDPEAKWCLLIRWRDSGLAPTELNINLREWDFSFRLYHTEKCAVDCLKKLLLDDEIALDDKRKEINEILYKKVDHALKAIPPYSYDSPDGPIAARINVQLVAKSSGHKTKLTKRVRCKDKERWALWLKLRRQQRLKKWVTLFFKNFVTLLLIVLIFYFIVIVLAYIVISYLLPAAPDISPSEVIVTALALKVVSWVLKQIGHGSRWLFGKQS